jgi:8-oxo-dGTP pyrophosphatase MutT (NUDIX family)
MSDDLVFVVDENDKPQTPQPRSLVIANKLWRRTSAILVVDPVHKRILCQKRSENKDERPGFWIVMFGGKSNPGETPEQTAIREFKEESGITLSLTDLHFSLKFKSEKHYQFEYLFWTYWQGDSETIKFQESEISAVAWVDIDTVLENLTRPTDGWYCYGDGELATIRRAKVSIGS